MARGLKFRIHNVEGLYYQCSENKGADQLRGYREADLRLVFAYTKIWFSHDAYQYVLAIEGSFTMCMVVTSMAVKRIETCLYVHVPA